MNKMIEVKGLVKSYGDKQVVKGIDFYAEEGKILGLLGPNGAGKSTTINILSTILSADGGEIKIVGQDISNINAIKENIGIVPQDLAIYEGITAKQNVRFFTSLYNIKGKKLEESVDTALKFVGLYDRRNDKAKTFSGGMKRRLNIACAIAHNPKLIIMDEPTVGIDPQSRNHILESIRNLKKNGATVVYTSHYMEEIEAIADRIIIMNEGQIIAEGTKEELNKLVSNQVTYEFFVDNLDNFKVSSFKHIAVKTDVEEEESKLKITVDKERDSLNDLITLLMEDGCKINSMKSKEASLETVFLDLTGRSLRD